jgi:hypothetical protein
MRWKMHGVGREETISAYKDLVGRCDGKRQLVRPRHRWESNIKVYLQEVGWKAWTGII